MRLQLGRVCVSALLALFRSDGLNTGTMNAQIPDGMILKQMEHLEQLFSYDAYSRGRCVRHQRRLGKLRRHQRVRAQSTRS